jgi:hypothetical protein
MHYVIDASYLGEYKLKIRFENDEIHVVDLRNHLDGPIFEPLKDLSYFRQFEVNRDIDTIVWPNEADFSPDFLYEIGEPVNEPLHTNSAAKKHG